MAITILFFGQLAELAGTRSMTLSGVKDTDNLKTNLLEKFPALGNVIFNLAVDTEIVQENRELKPGSTVAFLPPFSGG
jgi:sulfur-carrier protein